MVVYEKKNVVVLWTEILTELQKNVLIDSHYKTI